MKYKLFAFDLDGTLLAVDGSLSAEIVTFIEELKSKAYVTIATGRSLRSAWPYIEALKIRVPVVLYHGAVIFFPQNEQVLLEKHLSGEVAQEVLRIAQGFQVSIQIYRKVDDPHVYIDTLTPAIEDFLQKERLPKRVVPSLMTVALEGPLKLLSIGDPEVLERLRAALSKLPATVVRSERSYLEVLAPGVSKGLGLAWVCARLGIPLEWVVAVGDQESDVSMFECVGVGVSMAHAPDVVRKEADLVITSVSDLRNHVRI